jgi:hypothetical protein
MNWISKFFIVAIALLIATGWWLVSNSEDATRSDWQPFASAPLALIQQVQKDIEWENHSEAILKSEFLKVMQPGQLNPLYLIDTSSTIRTKQHPSLCGKMGCLFAGYLQGGNKSYRQVTSGYLNQFLPPGVDKVEITNDRVNGLPCLKFNQLSQSRFDPQLTTTTYCFDGITYTEEPDEE